jgi:predicted Zn-dependent peptidase
VQVRALPGTFETGAAVLGTVSGIVLYGRPDDYPQQRANRVGLQTLESFKASAKAIQPGALTWIVVGDLKKIEAPVRALNLGEVKVVDADGKVVR